MKKIKLAFAFYILPFALSAQTVKQKLQAAYQQFESDEQMSHAISSLYVINANTGEVVFDKNSQIGLAGASTQKIITATTAFELLGKDYRYKTEFGTRVGPEKTQCLWISPSFDPTFGSWRWESTNEKNVLNKILEGVKEIDLKSCKTIFLQDLNSEQIPDGWIWQDIGNYYGAGAGMLNWRENQFDLILKSGNQIGDHVEIVGKSPPLHYYNIYSVANSAERGSGDNSYIYLPAYGNYAVVRGTIPIKEDSFKISGSIPHPASEFISILKDSLKNRYSWVPSDESLTIMGKGVLHSPKIYYTHLSPSLDSIIYWFLKRSINLYGEALIKTFAYKKIGLDTNAIALTDTGIAIIQNFWKQKGLDPEEINIKDGSGLSPQNRITTHAQVEILKYAKQQSWFPYFFDALPEFNNMKMKSGTISDVKGFCGYHTSGDGTEYIFSFLINNYNGRSSSIVNKMYKVLDCLK